MISFKQDNHILNRSLWFSLAAVAIMLFLMFGRLNHYLFLSLYESNYYRLGIPAMVAVYLALRGFQDGTEMKILILYMIWAVLSRIMNGDRFLVIEGDYLIDLSTMILLFAPGILLNKPERDKLFNIVSGMIIVFYLIMAIICIYSAATRSFLENPIDYRGIGYPPGDTEGRLYFLSYQWNETAGQFMIAFGLCLMLFFRTQNSILRTGLLLTAAADFAVVGLTVSRNGQTCVCIIAGILLGILVLNYMSEQALWKRIAVFFAVSIVGMVLLYQLFEPVRYGIWQLYQGRQTIKVAEQNNLAYDSSTEKEIYFVKDVNNEHRDKETGTSTGDTSQGYSSDDRAYLESGRKQIFWSAIKSLQLEPKRLLIGSGYYHVMDISHSLIEEQAKHFHNTFLQVVNEFGLIGLGLVIWFYMRMLICSFTVVFKAGKRIPTEEKMLVMLPLALMFYYMLEVGIFKIVDRADFRYTFFYFICGIQVGTMRERLMSETE